MTVTSAVVATAKLLFGMCDCTGDSDAGSGDFSPVLGIPHVRGDAHVRSHVSQDMDCTCKEESHLEGELEYSSRASSSNKSILHKGYGLSYDLKFNMKCILVLNSART